MFFNIEAFCDHINEMEKKTHPKHSTSMCFAVIVLGTKKQLIMLIFLINLSPAYNYLQPFVINYNEMKEGSTIVICSNEHISSQQSKRNILYIVHSHQCMTKQQHFRIQLITNQSNKDATSVTHKYKC